MKLLSKTKEIFEAWAISFNPDDAQAELASKRIQICDVCEHKVVEPYIHCNQCGCALKAKIYTPKTYKDSGGSCPKTKWKEVEDEYLKTKDVDTYNKLKSNKEDMEHNLLKRYAIEYFKKFRDKDLEALSNLYADDIMASEVSTSRGIWSGKKSVLQMNSDYFNSNYSIVIKDIAVVTEDELYYTNVAFQLTENNKVISIIHKIGFNTEYKINSIIAKTI
jgi:hypothetical protein